MPATSDFNSSTPNSAWWLVQASDGSWTTVTSTGNAVVRILQGLLRLSLGSGKPTYDGSTIRASDITVDGNWGPNTYKGLWAVVNNLGGSDSQKTIIQANAIGGYSQIPRDVVEIAASLISANYGQDASIPPDANLIPYRSVAGGSMAPLATHPATQDEIAALGIQAPAPSQDNPVIQVPGTSPSPQPSTPIDSTTGLPTGIAQTVSQGSSIPWGSVLAVGLGVVAIGAFALSVQKDQRGGRRLRANPAIMGPRMARVYLEREPLDRGGYTVARPHVYFGTGAKLFRFVGEDLVTRNGLTKDYVDEYIRAADRKSAMAKIRQMYRNVRFSGAL